MLVSVEVQRCVTYNVSSVMLCHVPPFSRFRVREWGFEVPTPTSKSWESRGFLSENLESHETNTYLRMISVE